MLRTRSGLKYFTMGDGPEAVICHPSLGLGRFLFSRLLPPLSRHYRVVTYDPRGVGENAAREPDLDAWVEDVGDLLDEVDRPAYLIGVSLGTWVMARAAVRWPDRIRRLVLIGATPGFQDGETVVEQRRQELAAMSMDEFSRQYATNTLTRFADPEVKEQLVADMRTMDADNYLQAMAAIYLTSNRRVFQELAHETLFVVGSHDTRTSPRMADEAAKLAAKARVQVVPDAGHLALLDQPQRVQEMIEAFLAVGRVEA